MDNLKPIVEFLAFDQKQIRDKERAELLIVFGFMLLIAFLTVAIVFVTLHAESRIL